jgi:hypothetical protein
MAPITKYMDTSISEQSETSDLIGVFIEDNYAYKALT